MAPLNKNIHHALNFNLTLNFSSFSFSLVPQKDGEPPSVDFCPPTQKYKVERYHETVKAFWVEPKFSDNVKVIEVSKTNVSERALFRSINTAA